MTLLNAAQCYPAYSDGATDRSSLYSVRGVTADDTVDLASQFDNVRRATFMATTVDVVAEPTWDGAVVTFPAGLDDDAGWLLVWGVGAG